ncbi:MAG: hypothetical protein AB7V50_11640 [Vampirovibrionia bacterium]
MIKTKGFISIFLFLIIVVSGLNTVAAQDLNEISLPPSSGPSLKVSNRASVYLPSKLIIGQENIFIVKGKAGSKVSLAVSNSNTGAAPLFGNKLRLGKTEETIEDVIPATGVLEIKYNVPQDDSLVDTIKYFEVAIWKKQDYTDMKIAVSISPSGRETNNNGITIAYPPSSGKTPTFAPVMPGIGQDIVRSIEKIKEAKDANINPDLLEEGESLPQYLDSPEKRDLMLQNIDDK